MRRRALVLAAVAMATSCAEGGGDDSVERDAAVYGVVIQHVVDTAAGLPAGEDSPTVFLEALDEEEIALEVQAEVLQVLEPAVTVRFIDDRAEAVDDSLPGEPVRAGAVLLRLGSVPRSGGTVDVTVEQYLELGDSVLRRFTLGQAGGTWTVRDEAVLATG